MIDNKREFVEGAYPLKIIVCAALKKMQKNRNSKLIVTITMLKALKII